MNSFDVKLCVPVRSTNRSYVQPKGAQDCSVKRKQNDIVEPHSMGRRNQLQTKAKTELTKARSNKRKFGSFRRGDSGGIWVEGFSDCKDVVG